MNTPLGLMRPTRLPFGLKISPNLWQRTMDEVLKGLNGVACYLDDILVTGRTREEHQANLDAVMQRLQERGLRLRKEKCELFRKTIIYLGHEISQDGLRPTDERNVPADVLSRLPSRTESDDGTWQVCSAEEEELICATIEDDILPVTADQVARQTARDPVLGPVLSWVRSGAWPKKTEAKFQPYIRCRDGLTVVDGCLQVIPCCCETCDPARRLSGAELLLLDGSDLWCTRSASTAGPGPLTWTTCWRTGPWVGPLRIRFRGPCRTARCRPLFRDPSRPEPTIDRGSIWRTTGARLPVVHRCRCRVRSRRPGRLIGVGRVGTPTGSGPSALQRTLDCGVRVRLVCDRGMSVRVNQC
ncbi:uncharacterized protein K02A2.6-like isoform X2 [Amphibalanus amphitrite]|uniref:uncharacterized protein K02A2.6-like isoform X2 n=1 Tax=Amphibalanus amphitrite TaxID=1232801 RepID=UPI001C926B65|nr:uncharacterized protein K02A2.6-like isoform X2 [Amphibalanus amphitrite]